MSGNAITAGELRQHLAALDDDDELELPGGLSFYRIKRRGDKFFVLEVNEPEAHLSNTFERKNPHVKVAFIKIDDTEWAEDGISAEPVNVEIT